MFGRRREPAKIPVNQINFEMIGNMRPGDITYITPWSLIIDTSRNVYLDPSMAVRDRYPAGTRTTTVERTESGYEVTITPDTIYNIGELRVSITQPHLIPVSAVHVKKGW